jgi:hypothetical protein
VKGLTQLFNLTFWIENEPSKQLDLEEEEVFCLALKKIKSEHWNQDWFWIRLIASIMLGEHSGQECFSKWQGGVLSTHSTPYIGKSTESKCFSPALTRLWRASPRYALSTSDVSSLSSSSWCTCTCTLARFPLQMELFFKKYI